MKILKIYWMLTITLLVHQTKQTLGKGRTVWDVCVSAQMGNTWHLAIDLAMSECMICSSWMSCIALRLMIPRCFVWSSQNPKQVNDVVIDFFFFASNCFFFFEPKLVLQKVQSKQLWFSALFDGSKWMNGSFSVRFKIFLTSRIGQI